MTGRHFYSFSYTVPVCRVTKTFNFSYVIFNFYDFIYPWTIFNSLILHGYNVLKF